MSNKSNIECRWRYRNSWIDFMLDGMSKKERIKGKDKRILRKKSRRVTNKEDDRTQNIDEKE